MVSVYELEDREQADIRLRLRRLEGQIKGIQQMVDDGRDHLEVLDQLAAAASATNGASSAVCEAVVRWYLHHLAAFPPSEDAAAQIIQTVVRGSR